MEATPTSPIVLAMAHVRARSHFSGAADGTTRSYAIDMIVPSLRIEMMQMTKTGISKSCQQMARKKKKRIWIVHAMRYVPAARARAAPPKGP